MFSVNINYEVSSFFTKKLFKTFVICLINKLWCRNFCLDDGTGKSLEETATDILWACALTKDRCAGLLTTIRWISMAWNGGHYENVPLEWSDKINTQFRFSLKLSFALLNKVSRAFDGNWVRIRDQLFLSSSPFGRLLSFLIFLKHLYHEPDMFIVFNTKCHSVAQ